MIKPGDKGYVGIYNALLMNIEVTCSIHGGLAKLYHNGNIGCTLCNRAEKPKEEKPKTREEIAKIAVEAVGEELDRTFKSGGYVK